MNGLLQRVGRSGPALQPNFAGLRRRPGSVNRNAPGALGSQFPLTSQNGQGDWSRSDTVEEKLPLTRPLEYNAWRRTVHPGSRYKICFEGHRTSGPVVQPV